jgi:Ca2+-binding RTX toxin-like protein
MRFRYFETTTFGTPAAETLNGGLEDDLVLGGGGDDRLTGLDGNDSLSAAEGNDTLLGRNGADRILGGSGNDSIDGGADDDRLHGDAGNDTVLGGLGDDVIVAGAGNDSIDGGRNDDSLAGNAGNDALSGNTGNDDLWGGAGADTLDGGDGNDFMAGGFGADRLSGGLGNDVILSRSDAGEPEIAQRPGAARMTNDVFQANDTLTGGAGADLFRWELVVNAPEEVAEAHASSSGWINWGGVTGENGGIHDHWVDGIGTDVITDFDWAEGDRIQIAGHTVHVHVHIEDCDGDGAEDDTCIEVFSDQGANGGAHHLDYLGHIHVYNQLLSEAQVVVDHHETYGAYDRLGEGPHRFEDAGRYADDSRDWWFFQDLPGLLRSGTAVAELLNGGVDEDSLFGAAGADTLRGGEGDDIADGGADGDRLLGMNGDDLLLGGAGNDALDGGGDRDKLSGGQGRDTLLGGTGDDQLFGGADGDSLDGGRNDDSVLGNAGNDVLRGNTGDDDLWGGDGNDVLDGGDGNDFLAGGFGTDKLAGGRGNDTLLSRSDDGEPEIAQSPGDPRVTSDAFDSGDTLYGGAGADLFRFEFVVNAPDEVVETHADADGRIDWGGVTGENDGLHDHWVDGIGTDIIADFNYAAGDRIQIAGHTVHAHVHIEDCDNDGAVDDTCIEIYSDQGANGGAHHLDYLGHIHVYNQLLTEDQVSVDHHETYGAYDYLGQGPHRLEDAGLWVDNNRDWGLLVPVA